VACTILPEPALGAASWADFITLADAVRRGYMALSYTNFSSSAESAIAAGSLIEVAGAVYSFTQTAIDYTGAGSVNSDLYIYAKPDVVVSTATVVAWGSAPVWVDAKQGFYASAASITRAVGGMYVGAAGSYDCKFVYTQAVVDELLRTNTTRPILRKTFSIGEWNMDATTSVTIVHGFSAQSKITIIATTIRDDVGTTIEPFNIDPGSACAGYGYIFGSVISLVRLADGTFDHTTYDGTASTVANRGFVTIEYQA